MLLRQLRKNQWLKTSELEELQAKKLRKIIKYAYENTELYHRKFRNAGIKPEDIKTINDLKRIPITTKSEIKANFPEGIISKKVDISKSIVSSTGGSTGLPLNVVYNEKADDFSKAVNLRSFMENGLKFSSKWVEITNPAHIIKKKWFQHFRILNPNYISTNLNVEKQISTLEKSNPDIISGFSSSILLVAKKIKEYGIEINPKSVFGTADMLDEKDRKYINSAFGVEIIDLFGCVELNRTAWECSEHSGYHMDIDSVVFEFVKDNEHVASGERGEIVYTGLYNYAMPFIRYAIDDIGIPTDENCPCGRGLPLMEVVEGRRDDFIVLEDGRIISPRVFSDLMKNFQGIEQYKIVQETRNKIIIYIIKSNYFSQKTVYELMNKMKKIIGEQVSVEIELAEHIPRETSGKLRKITSKVKVDFRGI